MSTVSKDPRWREAEKFAERHARIVLARLDAHVTTAPQDGALDLVGEDLAAFVEHYRSPVSRETVERLHRAAGGRTAVCYSRAGYSKTAVLWADEHRVALFGYTDVGHAAPLSSYASELVTRAQAESAHHVRLAADVVTRHQGALRHEAERREREAHAAALRAQQAQEAADRARRRRRELDEATLGRTLSLLLAQRIDPTALHVTVQRLALSGVVSAVAAGADRLGLAERPHAVALVRTMFDEAAGALEVATPPWAHTTPQYRAARAAFYRAQDALDAADGFGVAGHVAPDDVARHLHEAEKCWRAVVAELLKAQGVPVPDLPSPRRPALR